MATKNNDLGLKLIERTDSKVLVQIRRWSEKADLSVEAVSKEANRRPTSLELLQKYNVTLKYRVPQQFGQAPSTLKYGAAITFSESITFNGKGFDRANKVIFEPNEKTHRVPYEKNEEGLHTFIDTDVSRTPSLIFLELWPNRVSVRWEQWGGGQGVIHQYGAEARKDVVLFQGHFGDRIAPAFEMADVTGKPTNAEKLVDLSDIDLYTGEGMGKLVDKGTFKALDSKCEEVLLLSPGMKFTVKVEGQENPVIGNKRDILVQYGTGESRKFKIIDAQAIHVEANSRTGYSVTEIFRKESGKRPGAISG
jgi:hypothetical protein